MKAHHLLKQNIDTLLQARRQKRKELAAWCRRSESWLSQIFTDDERNLPLKYLDRIADFFGLSTYQLFQPGISPLTERRNGGDRRSGQDRRISARRADLPRTPLRELSVTPEDEAVLAELHALDYDTYQRVKGWITVAKLGAGSGRRPPPPSAPPPGAPGQSGRGPRLPKTPKRQPPRTE